MKRLPILLIALLALVATCLGVTPASATSPPGGLHFHDITETAYRAHWNAVSGATEYQVVANGSYAGSSTTTTEVVDGLHACTSYAVQVKAKAGGVWSGLSAKVSVKTLGCSTEPLEPSPTPTPPPPTTGSAAQNLGWGTPIPAGSDEFDGIAVDATKWNNYNAIPGHAGNGRRMAAQSTVAGGLLTQVGLSNGDTGYLSSKFRPGTMYGKWETRMKVPSRDTEYHPVLLLWPDTGGDSSTDDEIDYSESTSDPSVVKFFLHYGLPGQGLQTTTQKALDMTQWHNYGVEWGPGGVKGYIDGVLWFTDTSSTHNPGQPMHAAIQLDYFPDGSSTSTSSMQVDWTRAYK